MRRRLLLSAFIVVALGAAGVLGVLGILAVPPMIWIAIAITVFLAIVGFVLWDLYGGNPID